MLRNRFPEQGALIHLSLHWTSLAEGNANFSIVIVFRYAAHLMVVQEVHADEATDETSGTCEIEPSGERERFDHPGRVLAQ
jgi:hypothetical protein